MQHEKYLTALYSEHSIPDVLIAYEQSLRETGNVLDIAHGAKLGEYRKLISNKKFLVFIRKVFNEIYNLIDKKFPASLFTIDGRRKSLLSTEKKILKLISANKSLDLLRDLFAFRILLFGKNSEELIQSCYDIANAIIAYFISRGFTLCEADPIINTDKFSLEEHPNVLIPTKESGIPDEFKSSVKDYIVHPKNNGYQSLHITFRSKTGECFEIQFRTFDMHVYAESGYASHKLYKSKKYSSEIITIDPQKIDIPGYGISPSGEIFDFIGLQEALEILKRTKTH